MEHWRPRRKDRTPRNATSSGAAEPYQLLSRPLKRHDDGLAHQLRQWISE